MRKIIYLAFLAIMFTGCEDDFENLNDDIKNPQEVPADALVANSIRSLTDYVANSSVNTNTSRLWAQHWAQTQYPEESNFDLVTRNINGNAWDLLYSGVIRDARDAKLFLEKDQFLSAAEKANQTAILTVVEVVAFSILVDLFGDIPYTSAFSEDITPSYDDDAAIYADLFSRLNTAIEQLSGDNALGVSDIIYGGDSDSWKAFANSWKLKMAVRIADADPATAKTHAEAAINSGVITSSAGNFVMAYPGSPPHSHPTYEALVESGRDDYVSASTLGDMMNAFNDPRRNDYFQNLGASTFEVTIGGVVESSGVVRDTDLTVGDVIFMSGDTVHTITEILPEYVNGGTPGTTNNYGSTTQAGVIQEDPERPAILMDHSQVLFLLADGAERGWAAGGSAEDFYNEAITSSILYWEGTAAEASDYLAQADVAYTTASGTWKEKIATQKYIALYDQGFEAWSTYRVYDAPAMQVAVEAGTLPPNRYTYPSSEYSINRVNVLDAGVAMDGDLLFSRVFWDKN